MPLKLDLNMKHVRWTILPELSIATAGSSSSSSSSPHTCAAATGSGIDATPSHTPSVSPTNAKATTEATPSSRNQFLSRLAAHIKRRRLVIGPPPPPPGDVDPFNDEDEGKEGEEGDEGEGKCRSLSKVAPGDDVDMVLSVLHVTKRISGCTEKVFCTDETGGLLYFEVQGPPTPAAMFGSGRGKGAGAGNGNGKGKGNGKGGATKHDSGDKRTGRAYMLGIRTGMVVIARDLQYRNFDERFDMHVCRCTDIAEFSVQGKGRQWTHLVGWVDAVGKWRSSEEGALACVELEKRIGRIVE